MNRTRSLLVGCSVGLAAVLTLTGPGCGPKPEECPSGGTGSVNVEVSGLPEGAVSAITLSGEEKTLDVQGAGEVKELPTGTYTVSAYRVASPAERVRRVFTPTLDANTVCVKADAPATVRVAHSEVPSGGKLWTVGAGGSAPISALDDAVLREPSTGVSAADVAITATPSTTQVTGLAFDAEGNLWIVDRRANGSSLRRFPAASLGQSGALEADVDLRGEALGGTPGPQGLAFDADGNLWVTVSPSNTVVRFSSDQLAQSGQPVPEVVLGGMGSGLSEPAGLAFDAAGNLWVASFGSSRIVRYRANRLGASTQIPDLIMEGKSAQPVVATLGSPKGIAFDRQDNLWVAYAGANRIARYTPDERTGMGDISVTPPVQITLTGAQLDGLAFDEGGGLWTPFGADRLARLSPSQLTTGSSTAVTPETVLAGAGIGARVGLAFYAAPAGLPLQAALP